MKTERIEGWKNSDYWPVYRYIEDDEVRFLGNNECICIDSKEHLFIILDKSFNEMVEMLKHNVFFNYCGGQISNLREQLKQIDKSPFTKMTTKDEETYLDGAQLGNDTFGISFHLRPTGFKTLIWESNENPQKMTAAINAHDELKAEFPELVNGDTRFWWHKDIIPFDAVLDWLKNLQKLLKRLQ